MPIVTVYISPDSRVGAKTYESWEERRELLCPQSVTGHRSGVKHLGLGALTRWIYIRE